MKGKILESTIRISGDLDVSVQKALGGVLANLDELEAASRKAEGAIGKVAGKIADQSKVLEIAKRKYASYVLEGKEGTEQAEKLADEIRLLSSDMKKNEKALKAAEDATDRLTAGLNDVDDAAKETESGFTVMKAAAANLVAKGIEVLTSACVNAVKSIYNLSDSTQEYREDMGKLETAWESAGKSTELATDTYRQFYSVLGEEDRSVEAVNHLAKLVETEQDMQKWTTIAAGVWGTFGDSLPIEGLTEAANETAKVGKVTGVLADALNWAGVNEEDFQTYLSKCTSEQERAAYITEMLNDLYGEAGENYRENNASIIEARNANADYADSLARIGEVMEPVKTAITGGLARALERLAPVIEQTVTAAMPFVEEFLVGSGEALKMALPLIVDFASKTLPLLFGLIKQFGPYVLQIAQTLLPVLAEVTDTLLRELEPIIPILLDLVVSLLPLVVSLIKALLPVAVMLIQSLSPIIGMVAELIGILLPPLVRLIEFLTPLIAAWADAIGVYLGGAISAITTLLSGIIGIAENLIDFIVNVFSGNWADAWDSIVEVFRGTINLLPLIAETVINALIATINGILTGINDIGGKFGIEIPLIPTVTLPKFAAGGFTNGFSIAGEDPQYPVEAVISFNPAYRDENLSYWAQAGRMLGADASDFFLGGGSGSSTVIDMGGVTFAPNITITGTTDKKTIMQAIEEEYPEFLDMLEEFLIERGQMVYA